MMINDRDIRHVDELVREAPVRSRNVGSPIRSPMERHDDDIARSPDALQLAANERDALRGQIGEDVNARACSGGPAKRNAAGWQAKRLHDHPALAGDVHNRRLAGLSYVTACSCCLDLKRIEPNCLSREPREVKGRPKLDDAKAASSAGALDPLVSDRDMRTLHRRPGDPMGGFLLPRIAGMRREGAVERFAINVLPMRRQRRLFIGTIGHRLASWR